LFVKVVPGVGDVRQAVYLATHQQFVEMAVDDFYAGHPATTVPKPGGSGVRLNADDDLPEMGSPGRNDVPILGVYGGNVGYLHLID
jgi:hypothetical protein